MKVIRLETEERVVCVCLRTSCCCLSRLLWPGLQTTAIWQLAMMTGVSGVFF